MNLKQILIVEDEPFQRAIMVKMFAQLTQAKIEVAEDGIEALQLMTQLPELDLIVCDLSMPRMDGVELVRKLADNRHDPILILASATATEVINSVKEMAYSYGFSQVYCLEKPIVHRQMADTIKQINHYLNQQKPNWSNANYTPSDQEIIQAIANNEIHPFFQPQIDLETGRVCGTEVLARWKHPQHGLIMPGKFIPHLTRLNLNEKLNQQMLFQSARYACEWQNLGYEIGLSININPTQLTDVRFADQCLAILSHTGFPAHLLTIEVTENELSPNLAHMLDTLNRLRLNGINISLDDFGTGHSSLMQMTTMPLNEIKIDQYFVSRLLNDNKCLAAAISTLALGHNLGVDVIAEGVEDNETIATLYRLGCKNVQGFYFSKALPHQQFLTWLTKWVALPSAKEWAPPQEKSHWLAND